jgi:hypothetical protein
MQHLRVALYARVSSGHQVSNATIAISTPFPPFAKWSGERLTGEASVIRVSSTDTGTSEGLGR